MCIHTLAELIDGWMMNCAWQTILKKAFKTLAVGSFIGSQESIQSMKSYVCKSCRGHARQALFS